MVLGGRESPQPKPPDTSEYHHDSFAVRVASRRWLSYVRRHSHVMAIDPKRYDAAVGQTLRSAPYVFIGCAVAFAILCYWGSPDMIFISFAGVSGLCAFIAKCFHWRFRSSMTGFITAMAWLIPYLVAKQFVDPQPPGLPVLEYAALSIGIISGLTWIFRAKIGGLRHDA